MSVKEIHVKKMVRYDERVSDEQDGNDLLACLRLQQGYIAGRVLPPSMGYPWRIQSFFEPEGLDFGACLPEGVKVALVSDSVIEACRAYERARAGTERIWRGSQEARA